MSAPNGLARIIFYLSQAAAAEKRPILLFDSKSIKGLMERTSKLGKRFNCIFLMPAKSFPDSNIYKIAAQHLSGFEVSNLAELKLVPRSRTLWITNPTGSLIKRSNSKYTNEYFVSCETNEQVRTALSLGVESIALRLNSGLLLNSSSRFGLSADGVASRLQSFPQLRAKRFGFHLHHGSEKNIAGDYIALAKAAVSLARKNGVELSFLNLGGGLASFDLKKVENLLRKLRSVLPRSTLLIFEPGRFFSQSSGYAVGRVESVRSDHGFCYNLNLSRECHLRWSKPSLLMLAPQLNRKLKRVLFCGPTAFEGDLVFAGAVGLQAPLQVGDLVYFSHICGYSVAWNKGFNGVPGAKVIIL